MIVGSLDRTWVPIFPRPEIPRILAYVLRTWLWLRSKHPSDFNFGKDEVTLTRGLFNKLDNYSRKVKSGINGTFESQAQELAEVNGGKVKITGQTDIKFILGVASTPKLIIECKKLDGYYRHRRKYCFDGIIRFVKGRYGRDHSYGVMCGFAAKGKAHEVAALVKYLSEGSRPAKLCCVRELSSIHRKTPLG